MGWRTSESVGCCLPFVERRYHRQKSQRVPARPDGGEARSTASEESLRSLAYVAAEWPETGDGEIRSPHPFVEFMPEFDSDEDLALRPMAAAAAAAGGVVGSEEAARDAAIVGRMASGDESALGELYDRWVDAVIALVARIVRDAPEAEEVVEVVFWQAWQQAGRFTADRGTVGAWLLAMARSRSLDRLRSLRRRRDEQPADESIFERQPAAGDPLSNLDASDRAAQVIGALQRLPVEQREVLELAYFEGLSQTEIAERLALPLGTVKTRARLALRKLRDRLDALREVDA